MCGRSRHGDRPKTLPFGKGLACKSPLADKAGESAELPEMTTMSQQPGCRTALATPLRAQMLRGRRSFSMLTQRGSTKRALYTVVLDAPD